jgi:hypothetical protein
MLQYDGRTSVGAHVAGRAPGGPAGMAVRDRLVRHERRPDARRGWTSRRARPWDGARPREGVGEARTPRWRGAGALERATSRSGVNSLGVPRFD